MRANTQSWLYLPKREPALLAEPSGEIRAKPACRHFVLPAPVRQKRAIGPYQGECGRALIVSGRLSDPSGARRCR
jgi:hypothetical protein